MSGLVAVSAEEQSSLDSLMMSLREEWGYNWRSLDELIERWIHFVSSVEAGYELSLHDYTLELEIRDALGEAARRLPSRLSEELSGRLLSADQRLRFATQPVSKGLAPGIEAGLRWWWFAVPRRVTPEFLEEFENAEPIE